MIFRYLFILLCIFTLNSYAEVTTGDSKKYSTTPSNSGCKFFDGFADNGDGTITDPRNGLIWMRCAYGSMWNGSSCQGNNNKMNWFYAMQAAKDNRFLGKDDWRLPTENEFKDVLGDYKVCIRNSNAYAVSSMLDNRKSLSKDGYYYIDYFWSSSVLTEKNVDKSTFRVWLAGFEMAKITPWIGSSESGARFVRGGHNLDGLNESDFEKLFKYYDVATYVKNADAAKIDEEKRKIEESRRIATERFEQERREKAVEKAALAQYQSALNNKNPQAMYLAAGKYARNGDLGKAQEIYERLIDKFPNSTWAVKASDQLTASKRDDDASVARSRQIDRASGQCRERIANCNWSCASLSTPSARDYCRGQCTSLCSP